MPDEVFREDVVGSDGTREETEILDRFPSPETVTVVFLLEEGQEETVATLGLHRGGITPASALHEEEFQEFRHRGLVSVREQLRPTADPVVLFRSHGLLPSPSTPCPGGAITLAVLPLTQTAPDALLPETVLTATATTAAPDIAEIRDDALFPLEPSPGRELELELFTAPVTHVQSQDRSDDVHPDVPDRDRDPVHHEQSLQSLSDVDGFQDHEESEADEGGKEEEDELPAEFELVRGPETHGGCEGEISEEKDCEASVEEMEMGLDRRRVTVVVIRIGSRGGIEDRTPWSIHTGRFVISTSHQDRCDQEPGEHTQGDPPSESAVGEEIPETLHLREPEQTRTRRGIHSPS